MVALKKYSFILFSLLFIVSACDYKDNVVEPGSGFVKYIDVQSSDNEITPIDIAQQSDGSLLILANMDLIHPYVLLLNEVGEVMWEESLPEPYYRAAPGLIEQDGTYYFTCFNNDGSTGSFLFEIDIIGQSLTLVKTLEDVTYTLSTSGLSDGGLLLQSYNSDRRQTVLTKYDKAFNKDWQEAYNIFEDLEIPTIFNHVTGKTQALPFLCGEVLDGSNASAYYFNGFNNYNFALTFVNTQNGEATGIVQGNRYEAAISSVNYLGSNNFSLSRFGEDGRNYLMPVTNIDYNTFSQGTELGGDFILHWEDRGIISTSTFKVGDAQVVGFLGNTKSGKLELRIYSLTGELLGYEYLGGNNFVGYGQLVQTSDGGINVLTQTALEDRFFKLALFKFSEDDLNEMID